jgi:hypothetical protein
MHLRPTLLALTCATAALLSSARAARADQGVLWGGRLGYYSNASAPFLGGELLFKLAPSVHLSPNLEVVFKDDSYLAFNLDVQYDFRRSGRTLLWGGAGLGVLAVNPPGAAPGHTDVGLDLLFGVGFVRRSVTPYLQAKVIAKENAEFSIGVGLRFR